jgi:1-phosphofructokinase
MRPGSVAFVASALDKGFPQHPGSTPVSDPSTARPTLPRSRVAVFGPNSLLTVTIEALAGTGEDVHLHVGGQGVWVARMAGELGAQVTLCALIGGESGSVIEPLLGSLPVTRQLTRAGAASGCYVADRREGERRLIATQLSATPSRHEVDDLVSAMIAVALESDVLVVCNPFPGDQLPLAVYGELVSDVRAHGTAVLVDLSSPRLERALEGGPDLVKLNDWELAEYIRGPVDTPQQIWAAATRLLDAGGSAVLVTRASEPAYLLREEGRWLLSAPRFERGSREGCGDSMMSGMAAAWAAGRGWRESVMLGAAAGAANFLRRGLGTGSRDVVQSLLTRVELTEQ